MLQLLISIVELCKNLEQKVVKLEEKNKILKIENAELRERRICSAERQKMVERQAKGLQMIHFSPQIV